MEQITSFFQDLWSSLFTASAAPAAWMIYSSWIIAILLVFTPLWKVTRHFITVVHEGGHAFIAILWGRRVSGIKLHTNTSGVTISSGKPYGLGVIFTTIAGYTAPAILGLALQWLSFKNLNYLAVVILAIALLCIFLSIRNLWGLIVVLPLLAGSYFLLRYVPEWQGFIILLIATFLTVASLKPIIELQISRRNGLAKDSDADQLFKLTFLPGIFWVAFFFLVSISANVVSIWLQLEQANLR